MRTARYFFGAVAATLLVVSNSVYAVQFVDLGFESPAYMVQNVQVDEGALAYHEVYEDNWIYSCITKEEATNTMWISGSNGYKGSRALSALCYTYDAGSFPALQIRTGGIPAVSFYAAYGRNYTLYTCTNLIAGEWVLLGETFTGSGMMITQAVPEDIENIFYRIQVSLP
jgi:hypothetical protein